jgi:hypothetical protein
MSRNYPVFDSIFQMKMPGARDRTFRFYQREPKLTDDFFIIRTPASRRTCTSLFVHGPPVDRSGTDDPDACRGVCLCNPLTIDGPPSPLAFIGKALVERTEIDHHALMRAGVVRFSTFATVSAMNRHALLFDHLVGT